ncbi:MAG: hypothetical protein ACRCUM_00785 [Mycoplasmoidaceae bacterium]
MNKITIVESKNEIYRYIYSLHFAKIIIKKKMRVLILDTNQISNFLDFPKSSFNLKIIKDEEPYKLKINTITKNTDLLKMPNEIFLDEELSEKSISKFNTFFDYLIEQYDHIICTSFITENFLSKIIVKYSSTIIDIKDVEELDEEKIIAKVKLIKNNDINYKIVLKNFDHKDIEKNKKFLYFNKFFNNVIAKQDIFFKEYNNNISFINPKIYDRKTSINLNAILEEINFNKNQF